MKTKWAVPLADAIHSVTAQQRHRFHFPAHAGRDLSGWLSQWGADRLLACDLTELPPLDVLGNPQGVLRESQAMVAELYGAGHSFYLINGASAGMIAALLACGLTESSTVLVARNCHRSVIHGLILTGAQPVWLLPDALEDWGLWGAISLQQLEKALQQHPNIKAFVMTHPSYEGIGSDLTSIVALCQRYDVLLIVDEAHASLWPLSPQMPASALEYGADVVVHSLHKSAGALTQAALLHLSRHSRVSVEMMQEAINLVQTTSPSYVLLAQMEAMCAFWDSDEGRQFLSQWLMATQALRAWIVGNLTSIEALPYSDSGERFQLFLKSRQFNGETLADQLEESHNIAYEAQGSHGVLLSLNPGLPDIALVDLKKALTMLDGESTSGKTPVYPSVEFKLPQTQLSSREAYFAPGTLMDSATAVGRIAKQIVSTCPPGIPILFPGEVIGPHHLPLLPESLQVVL